MIIPRPFYFIRHGEADWNVERRCIGQLDRPLTDRGRSQARNAQRAFAGVTISAVFYSPLVRAAETAFIVGEGRNWVFVAEPGLKEANLGVKQGRREDDPNDPFIVDWINGADIAEAESHATMTGRVVAAANRCLSTLPPDAAPPLLVAHSGVYHVLRDAMRAPVARVRNCQPWFHEPVAGTWRVAEVEPPG